MSEFTGCCNVDVSDQLKGLTFPMWVMYPTSTPSKLVAFGPFSLHVALEAPVEDGRFPLVIISHGSGSSNMVYRTLAAYLARHGFVVCLPEHPFNNRNNNELQYTIENLTDRPRHIRIAIDNIIGSEKFQKCVQPDQVAIVGHSAGGYTALAIAGGVPDTQFLVEYCHRPEHLEQPYWCPLVRQNGIKAQQIEVSADSRVKAIVLFTPDVSLFVQEGALRKVNIPVLMLSAEKDDQFPRECAEVIINGLAAGSQVHHRVVENAGHYAFLSPFPESLQDKVGAAARDPEGFDRVEFHQQLKREVLGFLARVL